MFKVYLKTVQFTHIGVYGFMYFSPVYFTPVFGSYSLKIITCFVYILPIIFGLWLLCKCRSPFGVLERYLAKKIYTNTS